MNLWAQLNNKCVYVLIWLNFVFSSVSEKQIIFACLVRRKLPDPEDEGTTPMRNTDNQSAQNGIPVHICMLQNLSESYYVITDGRIDISCNYTVVEHTVVWCG
jgi:hypothetical protein